ncbi:hypothetical protein [Pleionea litopenaei]|uniref:Uncharacterized protein n=1 Tax=Pleionea litopenaei TaxID=3070815 RepID=A0AA51X6F7_9GAMM|nr:hypothetical protein [Pleionea sp. HL-JVS1]WMS87247.1 hypothetical protein Q9312_18740 [Pleionea sp. HL-JVS1]
MKLMIKYLFISLLISSVQAVDFNVHEIPVPKFFKVQVVADHMNMNGIDMGVLQFQTKESFSAIESFYKSEVGEIKVSALDTMRVVSWLDDDKLFSVQVNYDDFNRVNHGFITVSNMPQFMNKQVELGKDFPLPSRSTVINDIKAQDLNKNSRTLWINNNSTVKNNIAFYKSHYQREGWRLDHEMIKPDGNSGVLMMSLGANELNLVANINEAMTTDINIVIVEK